MLKSHNLTCLVLKSLQSGLTMLRYLVGPSNHKAQLVALFRAIDACEKDRSPVALPNNVLKAIVSKFCSNQLVMRFQQLADDGTCVQPLRQEEK
jgi:hypothetical protein